jgi:hypothetical protein
LSLLKIYNTLSRQIEKIPPKLLVLGGVSVVTEPAEASEDVEKI